MIRDFKQKLCVSVVRATLKARVVFILVAATIETAAGFIELTICCFFSYIVGMLKG